MKRIVSAFFLILGLLSVLFLGNEIAFYLFFILFITIGLNEIYTIFEKRGLLCMKKTGIALGLVLSFLFFLPISSVLIPIGFCCFFLISISFGGFPNEWIKKTGNTAFGIFYVTWLGGHMLLLRNQPNGHYFVLLQFLIISLTDTTALYAGKLFGRHLLLPSVSPKKTIEGSIGGLVGGIFGVVAAKLLFFNHFSLSFCITTGIAISLTGQIGDLVESKIKRLLNVKDSGTIIPGHGGVLDRIDSSLFAAPAMYYYFSYLGII